MHVHMHVCESVTVSTCMYTVCMQCMLDNCAAKSMDTIDLCVVC